MGIFNTRFRANNRYQDGTDWYARPTSGGLGEAHQHYPQYPRSILTTTPAPSKCSDPPTASLSTQRPSRRARELWAPRSSTSRRRMSGPSRSTRRVQVAAATGGRSQSSRRRVLCSVAQLAGSSCGANSRGPSSPRAERSMTSALAPTSRPMRVLRRRSSSVVPLFPAR